MPINPAVSIMWLLLLVILALILLYRWYRQSQILQNLSDKYVLITGCDSGFGNLAAKQLDRRGLRVLAACLTEKGAKDLKEETSSRLQTVILDITDSQNVKSVAQRVTNIVGDAGLWGLVNNAGFGHSFSPNEWQTKEDFFKMLNVNLLGMIDVTLNVLPLIRRARGRIVNVSSSLGRVAIIGGGYCISKYGVQAFSDSLRREMRDFGIKVSIIEPGAFKTLMTDSGLHLKSLERLWNNVPAEVKESYGEQYYQQWLWGLVNNAGFGIAIGPNEWQTKDDFFKVLSVNLVGMIDVTLNVLPLIRRARGRIVNVSSALGRVAIVGGGYCISKHGVEAFSDSLRREMLGFGVKVSIIEPGAFRTPMSDIKSHQKNLEQLWNNIPAEVKERYGEQYYKQYLKSLESLVSSASPCTYMVPDCMVHALTAVYPWTRYSAGWDCKLYFIPLSYLPTAFSDYLTYLNAPKPVNKAEKPNWN